MHQFLLNALFSLIGACAIHNTGGVVFVREALQLETQ